MSVFQRTPWGQLGMKLQGDSQHLIADAIKNAGLGWQAEKVKLVTEDAKNPTGYYAIRRSDNQEVLGCVGSRYTILQNAEAFSQFQPFLDAKEATLDSAGSFDEGRIVWILAKINRDPIVVGKSDEISKFVLLSHSHDGKMSVRLGYTPIRIACQNTLSVAHKSDASSLIRIRHNSNVVRNLTEIRNLMNLADEEFQSTGERYRHLASRGVHRGDLFKYVKKVLDVDETTGLTKQEESNISDIIYKFEHGLGNDQKDIAGTWWAAYNGVTEWLSHTKGRNADSRISSLWLGQSSLVNKKAFDLAVEMAN